MNSDYDIEDNEHFSFDDWEATNVGDLDLVEAYSFYSMIYSFAEMDFKIASAYTSLICRMVSRGFKMAD